MFESVCVLFTAANVSVLHAAASAMLCALVHMQAYADVRSVHVTWLVHVSPPRGSPLTTLASVLVRPAPGRSVAPPPV